MSGATAAPLGETTLQDIEPPPLPPTPEVAPAALLIGVAVLVVVVLAFQRSPRARARRELAAANRLLRRGDMAPRTAVFQAAACLRRGFGVQRLDRLVPRPRDAQGWTRFLARLDQARYGPAPPTTQAAAHLVSEARRWLRRPLSLVSRAPEPWRSQTSS